MVPTMHVRQPLLVQAFTADYVANGLVHPRSLYDKSSDHPPYKAFSPREPGLATFALASLQKERTGIRGHHMPMPLVFRHIHNHCKRSADAEVTAAIRSWQPLVLQSDK